MAGKKKLAFGRKDVLRYRGHVILPISLSAVNGINEGSSKVNLPLLVDVRFVVCLSRQRERYCCCSFVFLWSHPNEEGKGPKNQTDNKNL